LNLAISPKSFFIVVIKLSILFLSSAFLGFNLDKSLSSEEMVEPCSFNLSKELS
jgi:hypothetical protein